ncbi:MAG: membrane-bound lytic murein transglycosylase MltF [Sideroxydans sp.]|nr:membrane-bound lytic murein transglycosylase MltF [Sideroxydans sp.]
MRSLLPLQFAVLIALLFWLWTRYTAIEPVPDWHQGELVVILPPANSLDLPFDRELAELFAEQLHVKLKPLQRLPYQVTTMLASHQAHFSAIGMRSNEQNPAFQFGTPYQTLREKIVCGDKPPKRPQDLIGRKIVVTAGSEQDAALIAALPTIPALRWTTVKKKMPNTLLDEVGASKIDCTVGNEEQVATMRNYHPTMVATFDIAPPSDLAWVLPPDADPDLLQQMHDFFEQIREDGTLHRLLEQYYGYNERLVPMDAAAFLTKIHTVLPHYRSLFQEAATLTGNEWQLLAAMAYRESHWNPLATSPTGVRGIMMLTGDTADRMGVSNRLDARSSIIAGAQYLQLLKDQLPLRITEPDRTWLALAAYNQGMGHLEDARVLTQRRGLNPDLWVDVKKVMPRISNPNLADQLKYGTARGGEAVIYVETVRLYYEMLKRLTRETAPSQPKPSALSLMFGRNE